MALLGAVLRCDAVCRFETLDTVATPFDFDAGEPKLLSFKMASFNTFFQSGRAPDPEETLAFGPAVRSFVVVPTKLGSFCESQCTGTLIRMITMKRRLRRIYVRAWMFCCYQYFIRIPVLLMLCRRRMVCIVEHCCYCYCCCCY